MPSAIVIYMGQSREPGACEIYRGNMPMSYLRLGGWQTSWIWFSDIVSAHKEHGEKFFFHMIATHDVFIFPRFVVRTSDEMDAVKVIFSMIRAAGKRIVYETDDDYTNEHRIVTDGDAISVAKLADAITVTTPYLGMLMQSRTKRPYHVLPNCIDPALWRDKPIERNSDQTIIALTGSQTHVNDWAVLEHVFPLVAQNYPNVKFLVMGYHPHYLHDIPNTVFVPGKRYDEYASIIRQCDIVLAPVLPDDRFNMGKSPIKAIEGQAARRMIDGIPAGAAVIATRNPVYELAVKSEKTGILVEHTPKDWYRAISSLLSSPEYMRKIQIEGHKRVYEKYDISQEWRQWDRAYRKILAAPSNNVKINLPLQSERGS